MPAGPAARMTDMIKQDAPHCHAPIHPPAPVPTQVPHPGLPLTIIKGAPTVLVGKMPQARITDNCVCVGPPDIIAKGSATVFVCKLPAARMGDLCGHGGTIVSGFPTVLIGG